MDSSLLFGFEGFWQALEWNCFFHCKYCNFLILCVVCNRTQKVGDKLRILSQRLAEFMSIVVLVLGPLSKEKASNICYLCRFETVAVPDPRILIILSHLLNVGCLSSVQHLLPIKLLSEGRFQVVISSLRR